MARYSEAQCYQEIERYVDGDDNGLTCKCMRFACGLPLQTPQASENIAAVPDPLKDELASLPTQSDALAFHCLESDLEHMSDATCRLATCLSGGNHQRSKETFQIFMSHGFWKVSTKPSGKAGQTYIPMIKIEHGRASVSPMAPILGETLFREAIDTQALIEE